MIAKTVQVNLSLILFIAAVVLFIVGAIIHDPPRSKSPIFWALLGLICFAAAFVAGRVFG
jgi:hypothetical protein